MKNKNRRPHLYIIAGLNGAGKTTFARKFLPQYAGGNAITLGFRVILTELGARAISRRLGQELGVSEMTICRQPDDYKEVRDSRDNPCLSPNRSSTHSKPCPISSFLTPMGILTPPF